MQIETQLKLNNIDLSFSHVQEWERTKHVHRLHPYLGKFIPQLVEVFLRNNFTKGQTILDPFAGSGTTLVESNILGMHSIGNELSYFNCLITKVKTQKYDIVKLEKEILNILNLTKEFSKSTKHKPLTEIVTKKTDYFTTSAYLNKWFAPRALKELLFYLNNIQNYEYQDVLKVILTRSARSSRLVPHFELTRAEEPLPINGEYYCFKHKRKCQPTDEALKFLNRYSYDTIKRIKEFSKMRTKASINIIHSDTRKFKLPAKDIDGNLVEAPKKGIDGIFTSPPYVGLIDYHDQHRYAYELLGIPMNGKEEIGARSSGYNQKAVDDYKRGMIESLRAVFPFLSENSIVFIVANDKNKIYPEIAEKSGFKIAKKFDRPVTKKASRERNPYSESIFQMIKV